MERIKGPIMYRYMLQHVPCHILVSTDTSGNSSLHVMIAGTQWKIHALQVNSIDAFQRTQLMGLICPILGPQLYFPLSVKHHHFHLESPS